MSADRLTEIEARVEAATEGPWEFRPRRGFQSLSDNPATIGFTDTAGYFVMMREGTWATEADMTLAAAARTDLPATTAALRAVLALVDEWRRLPEGVVIDVACEVIEPLTRAIAEALDGAS